MSSGFGLSNGALVYVGLANFYERVLLILAESSGLLWLAGLIERLRPPRDLNPVVAPELERIDVRFRRQTAGVSQDRQPGERLGKIARIGGFGL